MEQRLAFGPGHERGRPQFGVDELSQSSQVLTKVQPASQVSDCVVSQEHFLGRRRGEKPFRQCFLAETRPCIAEQFEERALPEEVEIASVRMGRIGETLACLSFSHPLIADSGQSTLVKKNGAPASLESADYALMHDRKENEEECGKKNPEN